MSDASAIVELEVEVAQWKARAEAAEQLLREVAVRMEWVPVVADLRAKLAAATKRGDAYCAVVEHSQQEARDFHARAERAEAAARTHSARANFAECARDNAAAAVQVERALRERAEAERDAAVGVFREEMQRQIDTSVAKLADERNDALRRANEAEAAAGQLRAALERVQDVEVANTYVPIDFVRAALATDAGRGWVSPADAEALRSRIAELEAGR
jgi:hypothetical protein